ncbi:MAG: SRPBCC domain-containing protein [Gemmatimonadaceae bacterium]
MNTPTDTENVLVVRRDMAVPREQVFGAWLDPVSLSHWMLGDPTHWAQSTVAVDARVGGKFRIVMNGPTGGHEHVGEYLVIDRSSLLSFTWTSAGTDFTPTVVSIEFHERGNGTEIVLTHRRLPAAKVTSHREGWTAILKNLDAVLTGGQTT